MMPEFSPDSFVMGCVVLVLLFFLSRAVFTRFMGGSKENVDAFDDYLLASKELRPREIMESTAATYSAFATVFFWFVALGGKYSWLLFLIPVFLFIGNWSFVQLLKKTSINLSNYATIGSYIRANSNYKPLHYFSDWIIFVFLFSALLVEIVIGSGILASMLPGIQNAQLFFIVLISIILILYISIGGFRAVVLSDSLQLYFTVAGVIALLVFSLGYMESPTGNRKLFYPPQIDLLEVIAFLVSVIAVQIFGPLCQLQNWQRICASENQEMALRAHRNGAFLGAVLWTLMIIGSLVLFGKLDGNVNFSSIFSEMKASGVISAYALYPILFVGFIAAMISTADSALAGIYFWFYDGMKRIEAGKGKKFSPTILHHIFTGIVIFIVIFAVYYISRRDLQGVTITVIYFLFNQLLVVFPVLFFFVIETRLRRHDRAAQLFSLNRGKIDRNLTQGLVIGWSTVLIMSAVGYWTGILDWILFASASGILVAAMWLIPSWKIIYHAKSSMG